MERAKIPRDPTSGRLLRSAQTTARRTTIAANLRHRYSYLELRQVQRPEEPRKPVPHQSPALWWYLEYAQVAPQLHLMSSVEQQLMPH